MSMNFQSSNVSVLNPQLFFEAEFEDRNSETEIPEMPELVLKANGKEYKFSPHCSKNDSRFKDAENYVKETGLNQAPYMVKSSLSKFFLKPPTGFKSLLNKSTETGKKDPLSQFKQETSTNASKEQIFLPKAANGQTQADSSRLGPKESTERLLKQSEVKGKNSSEKENSKSDLNKRNWTEHPSSDWWQMRANKKEEERGQFKDSGGSGQDQENDADEDERNANVLKIGKSKRISAGESRFEIEKPILERPKTGIFALYYILSKIGLLSDGTSTYSYKKEIEAIDVETTTAYRKRLDEMKIALEKEQSARRWGVAEKVFSWMGSLTGIIAGAALIATGVGAVAGAMMIVAGIIQITSQILELTGGWQKIAELLPGDDIEKKRAVISWIQIGISVLCLILSGVGIVFGGYATFGQAMQSFMQCAGGVGSIAHGTTSIGQGISGFIYRNKFAEVKRYEMKLAELKHKRDDLMEKVETGVDRLEQLFEDLSKALDFEVELFRSDQMINFRG